MSKISLPPWNRYNGEAGGDRLSESLLTVRRRPTRAVRVRDTGIGGEFPITVQSMTKTDTRDIKATVEQIKQLEEAGCQIIRVAVPDRQAAEALGEIRKQAGIPLVADIHFDYRLALRAIEQGVDKLRLNPGNIGGPERVKAVVKAAKDCQIPIRIGVNAGSLERDLIDKYGFPTPEGMVESALRHIAMLEAEDFGDIIISLKASDVLLMVAAYRKLARIVDYPLHLGVTEAGIPFAGTIKSAIGIGSLLHDGIGDTIRVSLTGDSVDEVRVGHEILKSLGLSSRGPVIIACPSCGRVQIDLVGVASEVERRIGHLSPPPGYKPLRIAVMGCAVNGPGEAAEADIGLAGGKGQGLIYVGGDKAYPVKEEEMVETVVAEAERLHREMWEKAGAEKPDLARK